MPLIWTIKRGMKVMSAIGLLLVAGCSAPPTASREVREAVSAQLGAPVMALSSGVYEITGRARAEVSEPLSSESEPERIPFATHLVIQAQPLSQSYGMLLHNVRFYEFDGEHLVLEIYSEPERNAIYALVRVASDGRSFEIIFNTCAQLPENFRTAHALTSSECLVQSGATVLRALALMEPEDDMFPITFEFVGAIPDQS